LAETTTALPSYSGQAYNGDEIYQPAFPFPLYVNLMTAKVAKNPQQMLKDHDPAKPIGHHTAVITATGMRLENGVLSVPNAHRDEVAAGAKNGFPWQASIRGRMGKVTVLKAGETRVVNGRTVKGPAGIVDNFLWRETTATGLGANESGPQIHIAASAGSSPAGTAAPTFFTQSRSRSNHMLSTFSRDEVFAAAIAAQAVGLRALESAGVRPDVLDAATSPEYRGATFHSLIEATLRERNDTVKRSPSERADLFLQMANKSQLMAAGGFSTINLQSVIDDAVNRVVHTRFRSVPSVITPTCREIDTPNFRGVHSYQLGSGSFLKKLSDSGEIEHMDFSESKTSYEPEDRAGMVSIPRRYIVNDDMSIIKSIGELLGTRGRQTLERDYHRMILGATWTSANSISGGTSAFGYSALKLAHQKWADQESDGAPIAIGGAVLLVQNGSMELDAKDIQSSEKVMTRADNTNDRTESNVFHGMLTNVLGTPWFRHRSMGAAASSTAWVEFSDPAVHSMFEVAYLGSPDGEGRVPRVDSQSMPFNMAGLQMRVLFSYGIGQVSDVGAVFAAGV